MNILFVAAEASPLVKVGGLADVIGSLPKALKKLGHDVRVMIPKYHSIRDTLYDLAPLLKNIRIKLSQNDILLNVLTTDVSAELKFYLIENKEYFDVENVYGGEELKRFLLFDKAVVKVIPKLGWQPDIVHCHDWHTGFIPHWLKETEWKGSTVFTIHNLNYQGAFDKKFMAEFGLEQEWRNLPSNIPKPPLNFISQGIIWSDAGTTVSEHYASEITTSEFGAGLDGILRRLKKKFKGINNGIDYEYYNPEKDRMIK
jgi:starch synthase